MKIAYIHHWRWCSNDRMVGRKCEGKARKFQDRILSWNNSVMDFEEGRISARGTVEITADDWGVKIIFTSESFDNPVRLSGVWSILSVGERSISSSLY